MLNSTLTQFAEAAHAAKSEAASGGVFDALGIDWQMLVFQIIGFVVLILLMGKFVYPILMKAVDTRQENIEEGAKAAAEAEKKAAEAEKNIEKLLKQARSEASDIVATAKSEAVGMVEKAEDGAKAKAERIVAEAHEEIAKDVLAARKVLQKDTLRLVKEAAGLAVSSVADEKLDSAVVKKAVDGASK
ncbi:F0F1 ATP synthase subunit B [Candidatus Saccharibacteria bacterium]|nr:F0F1 ATP synthase subunit B [Candidatus Saccharibacteria bacterium]